MSAAQHFVNTPAQHSTPHALVTVRLTVTNGNVCALRDALYLLAGGDICSLFEGLQKSLPLLLLLLRELFLLLLLLILLLTATATATTNTNTNANTNTNTNTIATYISNLTP